MANEPFVFQPVRGTEETIQNMTTIRDGYLYFAYDTGKIYLDKNGHRYPMGSSSSGISYAHGTSDEIIKLFPDEENSFEYTFSFSILDDLTTVPHTDTLILNSDGRFFRVIAVDEETQTINAILLAVSGTGGGGGSIITYSDKAKIERKEPESRYLINGKEAFIEVYGISGKDVDGSILDENLLIHWTLSEKTETGVLSQYAQGSFTVKSSSQDSPIWERFEYGTKARHSSTNVLTMWASGSSSTNSREFSYEFYTSNLELLPHSNFSNVNTYSPNNITIYCTTVGNLEKIIYYYFESDGEMVCLNPNGTILPSGPNEPSFPVPRNLATHGAHKVRIELYQYINGKADKTSSATPIEMEIGVVDSSSQLPVIWLGEYNTEYYQYDSVKIPFRVYDPSATLGTTITLFKDSNKIGTRTITDTENFSIWEIVDADLNMQNYYAIACGQDENEVRREISFLVSEDPTRVDMKIAESDLRYVFNASGRSNSESLANRIKCSYQVNEQESIDAQFENFNWYNNGWVTDENGNTCLRISNGAKFTIPLKQTKFATQNSANQSHTFEFQFKVRNVQDYSQILHNVTRYKGNTDDRYDTYPNWVDNDAYEAFSGLDANGNISTEKQEEYLSWHNGIKFDNYDAFLQWYLPAYIQHYPDCGWPPSYDDIEYRKTEKILNTNYASGKYYDGTHGICIGAQDALFTNGVDTVNVAYVEDKLINLSIVYSHGNGEDGGSNKLMSIYLNGMLTGVARSTISGPWNIGENDTMNIVFDSNYCDFDLYKIRIYNTALPLSSILVNYMVDLKDPVGYDLTKLAIPNNTLGEVLLDYNEMIKYNNEHPDGYIMPYLIFTTKESEDNVLPYSKSVPLDDISMEFVNTGLDRAYVTGELNSLADRAGTTVEEYYKHHCPSWKGDHIRLQIQGTSSEFYPRRNYKAKTKNPDPADPDKKKVVQMYMNRGPFAQKYVSEDEQERAETHLDWFYYDNNTVGTTKFTLKIDYMESSGTYNMGFANLVKNAYTHHPFYEYNKAGAFVTEDPDSTTEVVADTYQSGISYWYRNHKGNWKEAAPSKRIEDNLIVTSAEDFAKGPWQLAQEQQLGELGLDKVKVAKEGADGYNTWYIREVGYKNVTVSNIDDYRTSVQGFPVLAFHQTTDANGNSTGIKYIGRYNMLLDKGSDEAFGFKVDKVYNKFVKDAKNRPVEIAKVAECWEAENNSRGFCSFRDAALNRAENDNRFFDYDKLTTAGAPVVADYWEYRYNDKADSLDVLYELNTSIADAESKATVLAQCGVDIADPTPLTCPDGSYTGVYNQGIKNGGDALLDIYSNWEKAVKWVWSTNQDSVPSAGVYNLVDVGKKLYEPNKYYIASVIDGEVVYTIDTSNSYDDQQVYYEEEDGEMVTIKLCSSADLVYAPDTFYIDSGLGDYVLDPDGIFNAGINYYRLTMDEEHSGAKPLDSPVIYNGRTYNYDTKEYRNAKFTNDLEKHFNLEYLVTYFVMTEVFECYDSRGKNAMFGSWGPMTENGDYIWFPMFYDIDTQLGINNTGIPSFEYYVDATENGTFSTNDSILWNNLYRNFKSDIIQKYRQLKGVKSTFDTLSIPPLKSIDRIEKWYLADPEECKSISMRGERPLIALNLDEYYKYITITNSKAGYQDRYGGTGIDNGTYFYALQGDRSLSRQQFLTNRLNYIDSWLNQGNYERGGTNNIRGRIAANSPSNTSDKWIEGINKNTEPTLEVNVPYWTDSTETIKTHMFDGEYWITMEPVRNSYVTVGTDAANFPSLKYTNLEGPVKFKTPDLENGVRTSGGYHEQLYYIYGLDQMKSLGDMSKLYWTEFNIEGKATKMTDLLLGYDGVDENGVHYKNDGINMYGIHASNSSSDNGGMPLLKRVNLSYITFNDAAPTYDFSSCEKLEDFRAIGSNITNITFADGVALKTLYLPDSIRILNLTEATKLNNIVTSYQARDDSNDIDVLPGLYIPGLTDAASASEATSNITTINLIGDCLGYDSYKLLTNYYQARSGANASYITITDVDWSPYKQLTEGAEYNEADANNGLYWVDNGHYSFDAFTASDYTDMKWRLALKNGELYRLDTSIDASVIKNTDLLSNLKNNSKFYSTAAEDNEVPIVTGIIYVDNDEAVNEKTIENELGSSYPGLKLFFKNIEKVPTAKYVILNDDGTYDLLARRSLGDDEIFFPDPADLINQSILDGYDTRSPKYDFYGWSLEPLSPASTNALNDEEWYLSTKGHLVKTTTNVNVIPADYQYNNWSELRKEANKYDYVFYATYYIHKYKMHYIDGNGTEIATIFVPADNFITDYPVNVLPNKDDSTLDIYRTYKWLGWAFRENGAVEEWTNSNIGKAARDRTFYAIFEEANVFDSIVSQDYFDFTIIPDGYQDTISGYVDEDERLRVINAEYNVAGPTCAIALKPGVILSGKITLPAMANVSYNGQKVNLPITHISDRGFYNNTSITHIFFEENNKYRVIGARAFSLENAYVGDGSKLKYIDFTPSATEPRAGSGKKIRVIGNYAFQFCQSLTSYEMPTHLIDLGAYALASCYNGAANTVIRIGGEVMRIGTYAINNLYLGSNSGLIIGNENNLSQIDFKLYNYGNQSNAERRRKRINQNTNGVFDYVYFYSANYDSLDDQAGTISGHETTVRDAFDPSDNVTVI